MKKCKNGHYYIDELDECPYCPKIKNYDSSDEGKTVLSENSDNNSSDKTKIFGDDNDSSDKTKIFEEKNNADNFDEKKSVADKTKIFEEKNTKNIVENNWDKTYISETAGSENNNNEEITQRQNRKLVGWVISFTIDAMGSDFRIYEGKNTIGSAADCEITVTGDKLISAKHATILFRNEKFRLKDEFSTNGSYLNDKDIEDEAVLLNDGDIIKVGNTVFKFRTAL